VVSPTGSPTEYFLCEEKLPLAKEAKRCVLQRPLAAEEEVLRLVSGWHTEEGLVGRICLRAREEVNLNVLLLITTTSLYISSTLSPSCFFNFSCHCKYIHLVIVVFIVSEL